MTPAFETGSKGFLVPTHQLSSGVLYRNPKPHVRSIHAYFPSVVAFDSAHLGATVVLGEAFEASDCRLVYFESLDGGSTWAEKSRVTPPAAHPPRSAFGRVALLENEELVAIAVRHERSPDDNGITVGIGVGQIPMTIETYRSTDRGASWSAPNPLESPLEGPAFEMCSGFHVMENVLLWPTTTWPVGHNAKQEQFQTVAIISRDNGASWREWRAIFPGQDAVFWESKIVALRDGRLLAVAWVHDLVTGMDRPNHFSIGSPDGSEWSAPISMEIYGQTLTPVVLSDGDILSFYRRVDKPGLWATRSRLGKDGWNNLWSECLWRGPESIRAGNYPNYEAFATLRFGAPCALRLPGGDVLLAFWCVVDGVSQISWFRISEADLAG